ncbi:MAG TPA: 3-deoxy-manno-octulosonate cytidylyltransferase [Syntrophobacteraceae bacterium]|nr:3-deoxy-manno-octulosonate cytidylyltransferase [Syntrophobacteraceae bacterium]HBD10075.1 3-deoxy-manno-octulosonate cytidylyltransferase [Syntrophobacteraceae bacterium]HBZ54658.1 3-deoxy-manno-octulosonate cytidylyltransferase [Syntrophobacteraceae bacterium]
MRTVGIIPARYASTRFPGKPLADLAGKPMIQWVYERAGQSSRLDRLLVATDDDRIFETVVAFGGEALLTSPEHPSGTDRLAEAGRMLQLSDDDVVINIQGDEPLLDPIMVDLLADALVGARLCPMATLACESSDGEVFANPNVVKVVVDDQWRALYFSRSPIPWRRDSGPGVQTFLRHLGFYAYRQKFLQQFTRLSPGKLEALEQLEQLRALEHGFAVQVARSPVETVGVDTPDDLHMVVTQFLAGN